MRKTIQRELNVAFSKHAQPVWFRMVKYLLVIGVLYFFWDNKWFWIGMVLLSLLSLLLHFWFRYKTAGWTRSYGLWRYERNAPVEEAPIQERKP